MFPPGYDSGMRFLQRLRSRGRRQAAAMADFDRALARLVQVHQLADLAVRQNLSDPERVIEQAGAIAYGELRASIQAIREIDQEMVRLAVETAARLMQGLEEAPRA